MAVVHKPVLVSEIIDLLEPKAGKMFLDGTLGNGGHAAEILEASNPSGILIGIDQDEEILKEAKENLSSFENRIRIHCANFTAIEDVLKGEGTDGVDGIYLDLGVSSLQLDRAERGFSFQKDGPIDMRMDPSKGESVWQKIKGSNVKELTDVLQTYGDERLALKIAKDIIEKMRQDQLKTTLQLADIAYQAYHPKERHKKIHPATRTFQALRIWANSELQVLETFLEKAPTLLREDGRLCVISYHSLEDRIVKHTFRKLSKKDGAYEVLTKKPIQASEGERLQNPRSRSAKLRGLRRVH